MNIYEKIAAIMQDVQYLAKDDHVLSFAIINSIKLYNCITSCCRSCKKVQYTRC